LGGHAHIERNVIIGGNSAVQQFTRIGKFAMIGGMCGVVKDVIPYGMVFGNRSILHGLNIVGLRRNKIPNSEIKLLIDLYKKIFKDENLSKNLTSLDKRFEKSILANEIIKFLKNNKKRPICTPFS